MLDKLNKKSVIALGFFDSVHIGHRNVILSAKEYAEKNNYALKVFTFSGNLKKAITGKESKCVYTSKEREILFNELGVKDIIFAPITNEFLAQDKKDFLDNLNNKYDICAYFCGVDYRFGKGGNGDNSYLKEYAIKNGQEVFIVETSMLESEKISTSNIKNLLNNGEIEKANKLLKTPYFICSTVFEDRKIGSKMGFPTINIKINSEKQALKNGVYWGHIFIDGKRYKTIINYGARPTFDVESKVIEAHIIDFSGNLYGMQVRLFFDGFLRDIIKFNSVEELKKQIDKDLQFTKGLNY